MIHILLIKMHKEASHSSPSPPTHVPYFIHACVISLVPPRTLRTPLWPQATVPTMPTQQLCGTLRVRAHCCPMARSILLNLSSRVTAWSAPASLVTVGRPLAISHYTIQQISTLASGPRVATAVSSPVPIQASSWLVLPMGSNSTRTSVTYTSRLTITRKATPATSMLWPSHRSITTTFSCVGDGRHRQGGLIVAFVCWNIPTKCRQDFNTFTMRK